MLRMKFEAAPSNQIEKFSFFFFYCRLWCVFLLLSFFIGKVYFSAHTELERSILHVTRERQTDGCSKLFQSFGLC